MYFFIHFFYSIALKRQSYKRHNSEQLVGTQYDDRPCSGAILDSEFAIHVTAHISNQSKLTILFQQLGTIN